MHFVGQDQHHGYLERPPGEVHAWSTHLAADAKPPALYPGYLANCSRTEPLLHVGAGDNAYVEADAYVRDTACDWLRRYAQTPGEKPPFFLTVGFLMPHCPYIAPPELYRKYEGRVRAPELSADELARLHPPHRAYRAFVKLNEVPPENSTRPPSPITR
jgi:choline-sulfatase